MLNRLFRRSVQIPSQPEAVARAEQSLLAETLLLASTHLLSGTNANEAIEYMLERLIAGTPHIALAWAQIGEVQTEAFEPQIVVGLPSDFAPQLAFERGHLTQRSAGNRASNKQPARTFDVSQLSVNAQCRELAHRVGARSALVVPISNGEENCGLLCFYSTRAKYFASMNNGLFEAMGQWSHAVLTHTRPSIALDVDSRRDSVTGLHSRRHAQQLMDDAWRAPTEHDNRGVLMLINIDEFAKINAACGTRVGDMTLRHLARVLEQNLRRSDVIARWGGDEFLAWLPSVSGSTALATAEQLRTSVADSPPDALDGWPMGLRVSVGATPVPSTDTFASALDRADRALGAAKKNGRDCVVVARPGA
jgi:diguanylate cyclase (GGDEF)-like protein